MVGANSFLQSPSKSELHEKAMRSLCGLIDCVEYLRNCPAAFKEFSLYGGAVTVDTSEETLNKYQDQLGEAYDLLEEDDWEGAYDVLTEIEDRSDKSLTGMLYMLWQAWSNSVTASKGRHDGEAAARSVYVGLVELNYCFGLHLGRGLQVLI